MPTSKLSDQLYDKIKHDILHLRLKPGETVSIQKISELYGGSRTPVREAFIRLEQEGLVIVRPQSGTVISPISINRVRQERFVRMALETAVADEFVKTCSQLTLDTMEHLNEILQRDYARGDYDTAIERDNRFHRMLFETSDNVFAFDTGMNNASHDLRLRYLTISECGQGDNVLTDHERILEAARAGDAKRLSACITEHLSNWRRGVDGLRETCPETYFCD